MNRLEQVRAVRTALRSGAPTIGSWMQIPDSNIAEIMGRAGYQWVAIDMEHGPVAVNQLPDIFRALELGGTLPLARVASPLP
ncbi:MAG: 2,4-dihydroxyhept-2-ene-1,7-dioic acid aldolase, partial [Acidimicrobiaceae bacterium]